MIIELTDELPGGTTVSACPTEPDMFAESGEQLLAWFLHREHAVAFKFLLEKFQNEKPDGC